MGIIQDLFRTTRIPQSLHSDRLKAVEDIRACRTKLLGGVKTICGDCGHVTYRYKSCGNRHCPSCQAMKQASWVEERKSEALNVPYYHVVFTVPSEMNPSFLEKPAEMYNILFRAASESLLTLGKDPKWLGGTLGFIGVLHSWSANLNFHPHLHVILVGCGLDKWKNPVFPKNGSFFIPVKVLGKMFRGKFLSFMKKADLPYAPSLYDQNWVVFLKDTADCGEHIVNYLGRYTHRIAISDARILSVTEENVTFSYKDYRDSQIKKMTLSREEFIRRYLLHVLPKRFRKVRFYGFLASRCRAKSLKLLRIALRCPPRKNRFKGKSAVEIYELITGKNLRCCPRCGSTDIYILEVNPYPF
ncbi:MAG: IS91 family transposase [Oscillospiraceae bacterium]|nr:IS91 family transposase [Oscillospiraceae bacterium]